MTLAAYAARRTLFYVIVFFVVTFLIFFFIHALLDHQAFVNYGLIRGESVARYHLVYDPPIGVKYVRWLHDFFTGQWGETAGYYGHL